MIKQQTNTKVSEIIILYGIISDPWPLLMSVVLCKVFHIIIIGSDRMSGYKTRKIHKIVVMGVACLALAL